MIQTRKLLLSALFSSIIAVCAQLSIPLPPVPISMVIVGVFVCGALQSPKYACISIALYIAIGAIGLPVFNMFTGGLGVLFGPTGGYIFAYLPMVLIISYSIKIFKSKTYFAYALPMLFSLLVCYSLGTLWLSFVLDMNFVSALSIGVVPFFVFDFIKVAFCAYLSQILTRRIKFL